MSSFSNQLTVALENIGMSQSQLSEKSQVPISQVNKYAHGHYRPSRAVLERLCAVLPESERGEVAAAHLKDELPQSAVELVRVQVMTAADRTSAQPANPQLRRELREMFEYFQRAAVEDEAVATWLLSSYRVMHS